jgi:predicted transcriptional regulator
MSMINFACKRVPIEEIIKCSFMLNKTDYLVFKILMSSKEDELNIQKLEKKIGKDRTTIQRSIKNLMAQDLIFRRQINLDTGGFMYCYSIKKKEDIKKKIYDNFENWQKKVLDELNNW